MRLGKIVLFLAGIFLFGTASVWAGPNPSGDYVMAMFFNDHADGAFLNEPFAALTVNTLDDAGNIAHVVLEDSHEQPDPTPDYSNQYERKTTGTFYWINTEDAETYPGVMSADGQFFTITHTPDAAPGLFFAIKKPASPPTLTGDYHMVRFMDDVNYDEQTQTVTGTHPFASYSELVFEGNGNGYYTDLVYTDDDGQIDSRPFSYGFDQRDLLKTTFFGLELDDYGVVSADGSVFVVAVTHHPFELGIIAGIRKSSCMTADHLQGRYLYCDYDDETDCGGHGSPNPFDCPTTGYLEFFFDGRGGGYIKDVGGSETESFGYSLQTDGRLSITFPDNGLTFYGMAKSDGNLFILSETDVANPGIGFGVKTAASASPAIPLLLMQD